MGPQWCRGTDDIIMVQIITDYVLDYTEWHFPVPRFARINSTNNKINGGKKDWLKNEHKLNCGKLWKWHTCCCAGLEYSPWGCIDVALEL